MAKSFEEIWGNFFKPELRSAGLSFFSKGTVSTAQPSQTEVIAYIKSSSNFKVSLKTAGFQSPLIVADCNCPMSKKGRLCKHIWAALLQTHQNHSDFLEEKNQLEKNQSAPAKNEETYQDKQTTYRKQQYEKQKLRLKEKKDLLKKSKSSPQQTFPDDVQGALEYFSENGFPLDDNLQLESIGLAKKKLSRVFHPDIGGDHTEILELNRHFDVLLRFIKG